MWIREGDTVEINTGDDFTALEPHERPLRSKVLKVLAAENKVLVEGVNRVYKHVKRSQKNPQGGRLSKEMPISASNVMFVCQSCGKGSRLGARFLDDGSKERYCKKCGTGNGQIAPARKAHAKK